jgi:hypothetical protein
VATARPKLIKNKHWEFYRILRVCFVSGGSAKSCGSSRKLRTAMGSPSNLIYLKEEKKNLKKPRTTRTSSTKKRKALTSCRAH